MSLFFSALVWGSSVKHQPQKVGLEHILCDEDVVQIVKKVWDFTNNRITKMYDTIQLYILQVFKQENCNIGVAYF